MKVFNKYTPFLILLSIVIHSCRNEKVSPDDGYEQKADSLINLMMLEEKIGQLCLYTSDWDVTGPALKTDYLEMIRAGKVGGIFNAYTAKYVRNLQRIAVEESRMKIPLLIGYDVVHGHRTIFPIPLAQAASWDTAAIKKSERIAATEATSQGINWTFAPMVDLSRDPRWGRVSEGSGEDSWLEIIIATARVKSFQGTDLKAVNTLMSCVKHFAAYGAPQAGRDYHTVDMSQRSLFEWYLPPYKAAIDAGAASVMTSFNEIAGVPSTSNKWLLTNLLRNTWNFKGFVVTDYTAIDELVPHGVAASQSEAVKLAIVAGVDMDMQDGAYQSQLAQLVKSGEINEKLIDEAVKRILVAKFKLGLFEDPYLYCNELREKESLMQPENLAFAREFAAKTCVLLKNEKQTLPIPKQVRHIALIGPLGNSKVDMLGSWSAAGRANECVSLLEGLHNNLPSGITINYAKGCDIQNINVQEIQEAAHLAKQSDFVILALGESRNMSGEAASRTYIGLPGAQQELAMEVLRTGKPTVVVLFSGRPLAIPDIDREAPAILEAWFGGTEAGNAIADILTGRTNPSGKLTMTFPRSEGQIPIFYNVKNTGRPVDPDLPGEKYKSRYLDAPNSPLYPFGYGLSYTNFNYSAITLNRPVFHKGEAILASVDITNTGNFDGEEVVQLYIRDWVGDVTRPLKELKGFRRIFLEKGQSTKVTFALTLDDLSYYHRDMYYGWDPGEFDLFIGTNSVDVQQVKFAVK